MARTIIAIGGGEIRTKTTLAIDRYAAKLAKARAADRRAVAVFIGTASHDSLPYFNSFRKTYTSCFDIKADLALLTKKDIPMDKIIAKMESADLLYVGGGDTVFMLDVWRKTGMLELIMAAYERGVIIAGLSAGAICWFRDMYTDSEMLAGNSEDYALRKGMGILPGLITPHYDERPEFDAVAANFAAPVFALENDSALVFCDEKLLGSLTSGGTAYTLENGVKTAVPPCEN